MSRRIATCLIAISFTAAAMAASAPPQEKAPAAKGDLAMLKGQWKGKVGPNMDIPITVEFKDKNELVVTIEASADESITFNGEYRIDENATPKRLDILKLVGPQGEEVPENLGIYELKGDELKICTGGHGNERPTEFTELEEGGRGTVTLTRAKP